MRLSLNILAIVLVKPHCFSLQISLASNLLKVSAMWEFWEFQKYHNDRTKRRWGMGVSVHGGREGFYQREMFLLFIVCQIWQARRKQAHHSGGLECSEQRKVVVTPQCQWLPGRGQTDRVQIWIPWWSHKTNEPQDPYTWQTDNSSILTQLQRDTGCDTAMPYVSATLCCSLTDGWMDWE